jgi:hypothetical protein
VRGVVHVHVRLSVVIQIIQQFNIRANKPEGQSPICLYGQGIEPGTVARQSMQAPGRAAQVLRPTRSTQGGQQLAQALGVNGLNTCHAARLEIRLKAFVSE